MTDDQMRGLFKEMRDEPVPPESLARVRLKVSERTSAPPRTPTWWRLAAVAMLAAVLILAVVWKRPQAPVVATRPPEPVKTATIESRVLPDPPVVRQSRRRAVPAAKPEPAGAVAIRIETPDPDVVIVLLGDEGPGF